MILSKTLAFWKSTKKYLNETLRKLFGLGGLTGTQIGHKNTIIFYTGKAHIISEHCQPSNDGLFQQYENCKIENIQYNNPEVCNLTNNK